MLKHGADPNCLGYCSEYSTYCDRNYNRRNDTVTPLMVVALHKWNKSAKCLLDFGAFINQKNSIGQTALHIYCISYSNKDKDRDLLKLLLKHGADVNLRDANGRTALHYACEWQKIDAVELLLEEGAKTKIVDNGGFIELQIACHSDRDPDLKVKSLLESMSYPAQLTIEAYETLAWSLLREYEAYYGKLDKALSCMTRATKMREQHNLPKTVCDLLECYCFVKEWETMDELMTYSNSREQLFLQATLSRERIYKKGKPSHIPLTEDINHHGMYKILALS